MTKENDAGPVNLSPAAPDGPLPPLTHAGAHPPRRGVPRTLDDCLAAGSGTPGTVPTEEDLLNWEIINGERGL
ncbi:MAG: hypothetical protein IPK75_18845 [Acidobacteria bacterium]|nr:hypothetical protein [Acidobacteriota bacterium]